jgi:hypothetical protein
LTIPAIAAVQLVRITDFTFAIYTGLAIGRVAAGAIAADFVDVTYISRGSIPTTFLSSNVIACPITACLVWVAAANLTGAAHAGLAVVRVAFGLAARAVTVVIIVAILALTLVTPSNGALTC